jgi:hypothetical protein
MKKTVLPFIAVLLLLLISRSYLNMTKAQPLWVELAVPTEPFHNPPTIQIISPNQNQTVNSPNISLNFSITTPNSWVFNTGPPNDTIRQIWGNITTVSVSLDGNQPHNLTLN